MAIKKTESKVETKVESKPNTVETKVDLMQETRETKSTDFCWAVSDERVKVPTKRESDAGYDIYAFFDEDYRKILCSKILKHYYLREIGCETVGIWKLWVNTKLEEIMPYYNQLYESAKLKFDPFHDVDLTRKHNRTENEKSTDNRSGNGSRDVNTPQTTSSNKNSNANFNFLIVKIFG